MLPQSSHRADYRASIPLQANSRTKNDWAGSARAITIRSIWAKRTGERKVRFRLSRLLMNPWHISRTVGIAVRLINRTGNIVSFPASDSCLQLVCEVKGHQRSLASNRVRPAADLRQQLPPRLSQAEPVLAVSGTGLWWPNQRTKLRFRLDRGGEQFLYSNEFHGTVSTAQISEATG